MPREASSAAANESFVNIGGAGMRTILRMDALRRIVIG